MALRQLRVLVLTSCALAASSAWHAARAQAWVGEKGSLDASLDYNLGISDKVVATQGMNFPNAGVTTQQFTLRAEYVPIDKLAVDLRVPYVLLDYTGDKTLYLHPGGGRYDDGSYHGTFTDMAVRARYQLVADPIGLAVHAGISFPLANYETVGNAVAGRHIIAGHFGLGIGKIFALGSTTGYVHLLYDFTLGQAYDRTPETAKIGQDASDVVFTVGDKLLDGKLDINLDFQGHIQHDGINFVDFGKLPMNDVLYHDPILAEQVFVVGGGVGYYFTPSFDVAASARIFIAGQNTQNASVYGLTLTYSFI